MKWRNLFFYKGFQYITVNISNISLNQKIEEINDDFYHIPFPDPIPTGSIPVISKIDFDMETNIKQKTENFQGRSSVRSMFPVMSSIQSIKMSGDFKVIKKRYSQATESSSYELKTIETQTDMMQKLRPGMTIQQKDLYFVIKIQESQKFEPDTLYLLKLSDNVIIKIKNPLKDFTIIPFRDVTDRNGQFITRGDIVYANVEIPNEKNAVSLVRKKAKVVGGVSYAIVVEIIIDIELDHKYHAVKPSEIVKYVSKTKDEKKRPDILNKSVILNFNTKQAKKQTVVSVGTNGIIRLEDGSTILMKDHQKTWKFVSELNLQKLL